MSRFTDRARFDQAEHEANHWAEQAGQLRASLHRAERAYTALSCEATRAVRFTAVIAFVAGLIIGGGLVYARMAAPPVVQAAP